MPTAAEPDRSVHWDAVDSPLGSLACAHAADGAITALTFCRDRQPLDALRATLGRVDALRRCPHEELADQLGAWFAGDRTEFALRLAPRGTPFQHLVWDALRSIPRGETRSYGQLAAAIGRRGAARAVGRANGANPIAIVVPCHRVVGADGSLTGFAAGTDLKRALLELEGHRYPAQRELFGG